MLPVAFAFVLVALMVAGLDSSWMSAANMDLARLSFAGFLVLFLIVLLVPWSNSKA